MSAAAQLVLAPDETFIDAVLAPPARLATILVRPPARVLRICAEPAPANDRSRVVQADFWPPDPHPPDPERTKPRSLGIEPLSREERVFALDMERRRLPVVNEIPPREDCRGGPRPCPLVGCPSNNYTSRTPSGALKLTWPNLEPWEVDPKLSCAADIAERGGAGVKTVAAALNLTEERIRQEQVGAFRKLRTTRVGREWLRERRGG